MDAKLRKVQILLAGSLTLTLINTGPPGRYFLLESILFSQCLVMSELHKIRFLFLFSLSKPHVCPRPGLHLVSWCGLTLGRTARTGVGYAHVNKGGPDDTWISSKSPHYLPTSLSLSLSGSHSVTGMISLSAAQTVLHISITQTDRHIHLRLVRCSVTRRCLKNIHNTQSTLGFEASAMFHMCIN